MFDKPIPGYEGEKFFFSLLSAFGCAGTGGFGFIPESMAYFNPYSQYVMSIFLLLFGVNFSLYYLILIGKVKALFKSEELRTYFIIIVSAVVIIFASLFFKIGQYPQDYTTEETFRHALFQVASIMTTAGFATTDFNVWPMLAKTVLVVIMVFGAMAGSTAGGMKLSRVVIAFKGIYINIRKLINPHYVPKARFEGKILEERTVNDVFAFITLYFFIVLIVIVLLSFDPINGNVIKVVSDAGEYEVEHGFFSNFSATLACISNIGPGFEAVGPYSSFANYSYLSKIILSFAMILGRLEILPVLILFNRRTWKKI